MTLLALRFSAIGLGFALLAQGQVDAQTRTGSSGSDLIWGNYQEHTERNADFPKEIHNPDAVEQKRLRVTWGKPAMGHYERGGEMKWVEDDQPGWDYQLGIRGSLTIASEDGKTVQPVKWCQGVRVVVARSPNARPDWSKRHDKKDSAWSDSVIQKDGSFFVAFDPDEIRRPVGGAGDFQVALCLGTQSSGSITWKNTVPVLPHSIALLHITGPRPISPTLQVINGAPSPSTQDFDPVMLIRAVNHLHALGKDKAIAELRSFLKIARHSFMARRDPANIDTSDEQCVFLIVRLLFEPAMPTEHLPPMLIGVMMPSPPPGDLSWPLFPLALQDDVPFMLIQGIFIGGGWPEPASAHVDWAEKHGKLRAKPLRPIDNPLTAVESLCSLPQTQRLFGRQSGLDMLCDQAWRMIAPVVGPWRTPEKERHGWKYDAKADWEKHKKIAQGFKIRWDAAQQRYVSY